MIFQKFFNIKNMKINKSGIILIDILLALTLATLFVAVLAESSINARQLFASAKERDGLLKIYKSYKDEFVNLMPYQSFSTIDNGYQINANAKWYGNNRE